MAVLPAGISSLDNSLPGLALTLAFAVLAWLLRGVNTSGAVAGAVAAFAIYAGAGLGGFVTLLCVFVVTWLSTRLGRERKRRLGVAERARGRSAAQVLANLAAAAVFSVVAALTPWRSMLLLAAVAALAEAGADTASSECGEALSESAYLITTFERVPAGTDGAVSLAGSVCGTGAAVGVALVGAGFRVIPSPAILAVTLGAVLGMFFDSLLGATLERHRILGNEAVNFLSTLAAGGTALLVAYF